MEILGWKNKRLVLSWTRNEFRSRFWFAVALHQWDFVWNSKKEFIDSYNSRILKKASIDKFHTGIIASDVRVPPQRKSGIPRPETGSGIARLDFLPKLSFQNFDTNLPKIKLPSNAGSKIVLDGRKIERRRRPMTHPYLVSEDGPKSSIPLRSHDFEVEKNQKSSKKKLIWRPKSGRVNIRPIETPRNAYQPLVNLHK